MMKKVKLLIGIFLLSTIIFAQDSTATRQIFPGIDYTFYHFNEGPVQVHVLEVDLTNEFVNVEVGIANNKIGHGGQLTSAFVEKHQTDTVIIVGAVNGDFFGGEPHAAENCMVVKGEFAKGVKLNRTLFGITADKKPFADNVQFSGKIALDDDTVSLDNLNYRKKKFQISLFNKIYTDTLVVDSGYAGIKLTGKQKFEPNRWHQLSVDKTFDSFERIPIDEDESVLLISDKSNYPVENIYKGEDLAIFLGTNPQIENIYSLIGGLPRLVVDGSRFESYIGAEGLTSEKFVGKNPRTAVGFSKDSTKIFIAVVDGRQENFSMGMTLIELADFLISVGCYHAVNLDGGGSSTMVVENNIVNSPSDLTGERPVHNFLYVTYKPKD